MPFVLFSILIYAARIAPNIFQFGNIAMKVSSAFKPLIIAAALAVAGSASAVTATKYTLPINTQSSNLITVAVAQPGDSFSDTFGFNVGTASSFSGFAISSDVQFSYKDLFNNLFVINLDAVSFGQVSLSPSAITSNVSGGDTFSRVDFSAPYLAPGEYVLTVSSKTAPGFQSGAYGIFASLAPVPEPEGYAMFLAGLVIIAAIARRKTI
jgi:hypothetical protein